MAKTNFISTRRIAISKSNAQVLAVLAAAAFVTIFCLVAARAVYSQNQYNSKVINAKEKANDQLQSNLEAFDQLQESYAAFNKPAINLLNGAKDGQGDRDGSNSKLILDALPSQYDFPALTSSIEKILSDKKLKVGGITGTDDELAQQGNTSSADPQPSPIPFGFTVNNSNYASIQDLITTMEKSIRPLSIDKLGLSGDQNDLSITIEANTYFQPGKNVNITKQVIK